MTEYQKWIPPRHPMAMVDHLIELQPGKKAVGIKDVSMTEPFFKGHFPKFPIMPGVLIVEGLSQTALAMLRSSKEFGDQVHFSGINQVRFREQVKPGDLLIYEVEFLQKEDQTAIVKAIAKVGSEIVVDSRLKFNGN